MNLIDKISAGLKYILTPSNKNLRVVLLCVIGATTFWFFNALNKNYTTSLRYPVVFEYEKDSTVLVSDLPEYIDINVSGGGWELLRKTIWFNKNFMSISIENPFTTNYISGEQLFSQLNQELNDIVLNDVLTDTIFIDIQPYVEKKLNLKVDSTMINIRNGFSIISEIRINPDTVIIGGPVELIDTIGDKLTVPIPINNIDNDINENIVLQMYDPRIVRFYPSTVNVRFEVARYINADTEVDVELVNFPYDSSANITPSTVQISFEVNEFYEKRFRPIDFLVIADYSDISDKDSTIRLEIVQTPQYVRNAKLDSSFVKVIYEK